MVALFLSVYAVARTRWPQLPDNTILALAALLAAPLALAFLWPRLAGFKAFGFEVSLAQATVHLEAEIVAAITTEQYFSGKQALIDRLTDLIVRPETEVIEVNLRGAQATPGQRGYWWSTRLYLLAALIDDFSRVQTVAFVENDAERRFIGMVRPSDIRSALATISPILETTYRGIRQNQLAALPRDAISPIVTSWAASKFQKNGKVLGEADFTDRVNKEVLSEWLTRTGKHLRNDSIDWDGVVDSRVIRSLVLEYDSPHVALLRSGRLDRLVNRLELAVRIVDRMAAG